MPQSFMRINNTDRRDKVFRMEAYFILHEKYLLHEIDARLQIHTKIHEHPFDSFPFVLFLFKNKHMMIEKLLQFLVCEIDTQLLKTIKLKVYNKEFEILMRRLKSIYSGSLFL